MRPVADNRVEAARTRLDELRCAFNEFEWLKRQIHETEQAIRTDSGLKCIDRELQSVLHELIGTRPTIIYSLETQF